MSEVTKTDTEIAERAIRLATTLYSDVQAELASDVDTRLGAAGILDKFADLYEKNQRLSDELFKSNVFNLNVAEENRQLRVQLAEAKREIERLSAELADARVGANTLQWLLDENDPGRRGNAT